MQDHCHTVSKVLLVSANKLKVLDPVVESYKSALNPSVVGDAAYVLQ